MPTKQITVCAHCGKISCDGGMWVYVRVVEGDKDCGLSGVHKENRGPKCSLDLGLRQYKHLKGKQVGDEVTLFYPNWVRPAHLTVRKVEA